MADYPTSKTQERVLKLFGLPQATSYRDACRILENAGLPDKGFPPGITSGRRVAGMSDGELRDALPEPTGAIDSSVLEVAGCDEAAVVIEAVHASADRETFLLDQMPPREAWRRIRQAELCRHYSSGPAGWRYARRALEILLEQGVELKIEGAKVSNPSELVMALSDAHVSGGVTIRRGTEKNRVAAITWARSLLEDESVVVLDSETTGLGSRLNLIEIAVVDTSGEPLFSSLIKPPSPVDRGAKLVHDIDEKDLRDAPSFAEVYPTLKRALDGRRVVAYNADFDRRVLEGTVERYGLIGPRGLSWECAMHWYARFVGEWSEYHGKYRWHKLPGAEHRALEDARAALTLVRGIAHGEPPTSTRSRSHRRTNLRWVSPL